MKRFLFFIILLIFNAFSAILFANIQEPYLSLADWQNMKKCITTQSEFKANSTRFAPCTVTFIKPDIPPCPGTNSLTNCYHPGIIDISIVNTTGTNIVLETPSSLQTASSQVSTNGSFAATGNCISSDNSGLNANGIPITVRPYSGRFCLFNETNGTTCGASVDYDNKIRFSIPTTSTVNNPCRIRLKMTSIPFDGDDGNQATYLFNELILGPPSCTTASCAAYITFFTGLIDPVFVTQNTYTGSQVGSWAAANAICQSELTTYYTNQGLTNGYQGTAWLSSSVAGQNPSTVTNSTFALGTLSGELFGTSRTEFFAGNMNNQVLNQVFDVTSISANPNVYYLGPNVTDINYNYASLFTTGSGTTENLGCTGTVTPGGNTVPSVTNSTERFIPIWSATDQNGNYSGDNTCTNWSSDAGTGGTGKLYYFKAPISSSNSYSFFNQYSWQFCSTKTVDASFAWTSSGESSCSTPRRILCTVE